MIYASVKTKPWNNQSAEPVYMRFIVDTKEQQEIFEAGVMYRTSSGGFLFSEDGDIYNKQSPLPYVDVPRGTRRLSGYSRLDFRKEAFGLVSEESPNFLSKFSNFLKSLELAKICPICKRKLGRSSDQHHLIPKTHGGKEKIVLHKICHNKIHSVFTERELLKFYHTIDRIISHDEIKKFIKWVANKDPEFYVKTKNHLRKKR